MDRGKGGDEKQKGSKDVPQQKSPEKKLGATVVAQAAPKDKSSVPHKLERAVGIDRKDSGIIPAPHKLERAGGIDRSDSKIVPAEHKLERAGGIDRSDSKIVPAEHKLERAGGIDRSDSGVAPAEHKLERSGGIDRSDSKIVPAEHKLERSGGIDRSDSDVVCAEQKLESSTDVEMMEPDVIYVEQKSRATGIEKMDSQEISEEHSSEIVCEDRLESEATHSYELLQTEGASDEEFEIIDECVEDVGVERNLEGLKLEERVPAERQGSGEQKPAEEENPEKVREDLLAGRMFEVNLQFDHLSRLIAPNMKFYMRSPKHGQPIEECTRRRVTAADLNIDPIEIRKQNGKPKLVVDTGLKSTNNAQQQKPSKNFVKLLSDSKWVESKTDVKSEGGVLFERKSRNGFDSATDSMEPKKDVPEMIVDEAMQAKPDPSSESPEMVTDPIEPEMIEEEMPVEPEPSFESRAFSLNEEAMAMIKKTGRRPKKLVRGRLTLYSLLGSLIWSEEVDIVSADFSSNDDDTDHLIVYDDSNSSSDLQAEPSFGIASGTPQRSMDSETTSYAVSAATSSGETASKSISAATSSGDPVSKSLSAATFSADPASKSLSAATFSADPASKSLSSGTSSGDPASKSLSSATSSGDPASKSLTTTTSSGDPASKSLSAATSSGDPASKSLSAATSSGDSATKSISTEASSVGAVYSSDGPSELTTSSGVGDSTLTPSLSDITEDCTESSGISAGSVPTFERADSPYPMPDKSTESSQSSTGLLAYSENTSSISLAKGDYEPLGRTTSPCVAVGFVVNVGSVVPEILVSASEPTTSAAPDTSGTDTTTDTATDPTTEMAVDPLTDTVTDPTTEPITDSNVSSFGDSSAPTSSRPDSFDGRLGRRNALVPSDSDDTTASSIPLDTPDSVSSSVFGSRSVSTVTSPSEVDPEVAPEADAPPRDTASPASVGRSLVPPTVPPRNPKKN